VRLLLDECIPRPFGRHLAPHEVGHVTTLGWAGVRNGRLLELMRSSGFAGLVTVDRNLADQQDIPNSGVFVVLLVSRSNRLDSLVRLAPEMLRAVEFAAPGQLVRVSL
jgi:hypothetical protein